MKENIFIFDIDGVIRDVSMSYRKSIQLTVKHYTNYMPSMHEIDLLKSEGIFNNDWDLSLELIKRKKNILNNESKFIQKEDLVSVFNNFYFGNSGNFSDIESGNGLIKQEKLLINRQFFDKLDSLKYSYGFVSGSEKESAEFILKKKLGLKDLNLISMNDAPGKPNPKGLITMINKLKKKGKSNNRSIFYIGDTVSDTLTVMNAKKVLCDEKIISVGIIPPHLQKPDCLNRKKNYSEILINAGSEVIIDSLNDLLDGINKFLGNSFFP